MMKELYAFLLAGTLMVPHIAPALGADGTTRPSVSHQGQTLTRSAGQLQLPPVPGLELPESREARQEEGVAV